MKTTVKVVSVARNGFFGLKVSPEELETGQGGVSELSAVLTKSE
jgi:hypothetical protein